MKENCCNLLSIVLAVKHLHKKLSELNELSFSILTDSRSLNGEKVLLRLAAIKSCLNWAVHNGFAIKSATILNLKQ